MLVAWQGVLGALFNLFLNCILTVWNGRRFLHDTVGSYVKNAQSSNRPDLVKLWQTIKQDRQKHAKTLREALKKNTRIVLLIYRLNLFLISCLLAD
jgi:hypothetical protein